MFGKILDTAFYLKARITKDELELALNEATTDDNWQASTSVLHQITSSAYDKDKWKRISEFIWDKLKNNKNWKKILKTLNIVEFLIKNGPEFTGSQFKYELRFFKTMEGFQEYEGGTDRGSSIRERAKAIVALLENDELREDERLRAHQIRERMSHLTGSSYNSEGTHKQSHDIPKYDNYNSESYSASKEDSHGYYNYGKGNYGDRDEDKKYDHDYFENINRFKQDSPTKISPTNYPPPEPQSPKAQVPDPRHQTVPPVRAAGQQPSRATAKPKFETITQLLMKNPKNKAANQVIVKPDQSYKALKNEEQLIDLSEQHYMESRYQFQNEPQTIEYGGQIEAQRPAPLLVDKPQLPQVATNQPPPQQQKFSELESFSFPGVSAGQTSNNQVEADPLPNSQSITQPQTTPVNQPPASPVYTQPAPTQPAPTQTASPYAPPPPFNQAYNPQPSNNYSHGYNQGYPAQQYNNYGQPAYNPPSNYGYQPTQQPSYSQPAYNPYGQAHPYPYDNYSKQTTQISLGPTTSQQAPPSSKEGGDSAEKKGKVSLNDMMDLSDIVTDFAGKRQDSPAKAPPKEHSNNLNMDQWAW